jgi:hypothetical protein
METAKLKVKSVAFASAVLWGLGVLFVGLMNIYSTGYGQAFLEVVSSIYPGYKADPNITSVVIGTLYAIMDGAIGGSVFAWLYNRCACKG